MKNKPLQSPPLAPPATRAQVEKFLKELQQFRAKGFAPLDEVGPLDEVEVKKYDQAGVKDYLDKITAGMQQSIARRIMMDILKPPQPKERGQQKRITKKKKDSSTKSARGATSKRSPAKARKARKRK
jgi:hypothetical protein